MAGLEGGIGQLDLRVDLVAPGGVHQELPDAVDLGHVLQPSGLGPEVGHQNVPR